MRLGGQKRKTSPTSVESNLFTSRGIDQGFKVSKNFICFRFDATVTNPDTEDEFAKISFMIVSIGKFKGKKTYLDYGGKIIALDSKSDEVPASEVVPSGESFYLTCRLDKTACAKKIWNGESGSHGTDDGPMSE